MRRIAAGLALTLSLAVFASAATRRPDAPAPAVVPALEAGARPVPISLARIAAAGEPLRWRGSADAVGDADLAQALRAEFSKAGLTLAEAPNAADLQLGARITDVQVRLGARGVAVMAVEWQVYSTAAGKVVGKILTRGGVPVAKGERLGETIAGLLRPAFAENVRQLAADPGFRQIAVVAAPPRAMQVGYRYSARPTALKEAVGGVVVIFVGEEMGSGALISPDGYILTNQHVIKQAGHVRIRWADGGETDGQVVRADVRRDVALIKAASASQRRPLAIRRSPVDLGETVFAIGTPMSDAYQNTVTRGIVSATRSLDGQSFIQSDAGMTHGNSGGPLVDQNGAVVGLADLTVDAAQGSTINFFIPIGEALKALALQPAG